MNPTRLLTVAALASASILAACGPDDDVHTVQAATPRAPTTSVRTAPPQAPMHAAVQRGELGTVTAVVPLVRSDGTSGAGAVIGGVVGAAVGNQVGKGDGRKVATVLGALGGAAVGNHVEKERNTHVTGYRVDVRLDGGGTTSVTLPDSGGLASGRRVRLVEGTVVPA